MHNSGLATIDPGLRWRMLILRAAGIDPDGRCVPMGTGKVAQDTPAAAERAANRAAQDYALLRALYQPAMPWW